MAREYAGIWTIRGNQWLVTFKREINGGNDVGLCIPSTKTIYLAQGLGKKETARTFWHEIVHAFEEEYGFDIPHKYVFKLELALEEFMDDNRDRAHRIYKPRTKRRGG